MLSPLFALPSAVAAQVDFEFVPYAGVYIPTRPLVDGFSTGPLWGCDCQLSLKQKRSVTLGGRLAVWWTNNLGLEATLGYSPSGLSTVGAQPRDSSADVITASARAVIRISPTGGSPWLRLGGGVGLVSRGGGAYREGGVQTVCGTDHFAGVVSVGAAFTFGRRALALRFNAEDYWYSARLRTWEGGSTCGECRGHSYPRVCNLLETTSPTSNFQDDLVLSVGLAVPLGGR